MLLPDRFMNVKKFNNEIPWCTLSGSTDLYRLKWEAFLSMLIIRDLHNKSMLPYELYETAQPPYDVHEGWAVEIKILFLKESCLMCRQNYISSSTTLRNSSSVGNTRRTSSIVLYVATPIGFSYPCIRNSTKLLFACLHNTIPILGSHTTSSLHCQEYVNRHSADRDMPAWSLPAWFWHKPKQPTHD